jgi:iron complex transport system substrate-binding protein
MKRFLIVAALVVAACAGSAHAARRTGVPGRIVSLSPTATVDLFAIGAGRQVVAVDSFSTYPKNAPHTKLSAYNPNVEAIARYRPDLVVVYDDSHHLSRQLAKLHIRVLLQPAAANLQQVYAQLVQLGRTTGHVAGAQRVVGTMKRQVVAVVKSVPRPKKPLTVYHELDQTYYSATSHTFIGQMYSLLGLKNIADAAGSTTDYPQLSAEYIVASDPDVIVLADTVCCGQTLAKVAARPGWSTIKAVQTHEVVLVDDSIASQWSPRIVLFLKAVAAAVRKLEHG